jgi:PAS domain S-box-containing protein
MNKQTPSSTEAPSGDPRFVGRHRRRLPLKSFYLVLIGGWTAFILLSVLYNTSHLERHALDSARLEARTAVEKDIVYRRWVSEQGGVFVAMHPGGIRPNPYLPAQGREIVDRASGRRYTKINPAYMTRLVHEIGVLRTGVRGHITSRNPIRKGNEPDPWERAALNELEKKRVLEVSSLQLIDNREYLRLMRGLTTEPSCLPCHSGQGYAVGDLRGGISVDVPMEPFWSAVRQSRHTLYFSHIAIWCLGFLGISGGARKIALGMKERDSAEHELRGLAAQLEDRVAERTKALRRRQMEMRAFVDNVEAGVFLKDGEGVYHIVNARFARIFGLSAEGMEGRKDRDILPEATYARLREMEEQVAGEGRSHMFRSGIVSRRGARYTCFLFPVKEDERVSAVGGLLVDVSERDRLEEVLLRAKEAAEKASKAKSHFVANMSHEIRTPLNGVIGMADLLLRSRLNPDQASMAAAIKASGDSLLTVLNAVLDISKIEAGRLELERISFPLRDMLFSAVRGLAPIAYKKGVELLLHVSPAAPEHLLGDPTRIRQIILNLTGNALKFTDQGEVIITVARVSAQDDKARLRFTVTDTGIGIPEDKRQVIFQAFEQVDASTTRKYGGSGLGLAICARLLSLMDSRLEVTSREGAGSSFWFDLDLSVDKEAAGRGQGPVRAAELRNLRALVVDDNETNLLILRETLNLWGMRTETAHSAGEALSRLQTALADADPFAIVLTDMQMPGKSGLDLLRLVRDEAGIARTPIVLLTSGNPPDEAERAACRGEFFAAVLDKPVRTETLLWAVTSALRIGGGEAGEGPGKERSSGDEGMPPLKVLLVEDVEMNRLVAGRMLRELGHAPVMAANGREALEAVRDGDFDLIFMDVQMPVMDGMQAAEAIRKLENNGTLKGRRPIIAMTANALAGDRDRCLEAGMDGYLAKPISLEELREVIRQVMGQGAQGPERPSGAAPRGKALLDGALLERSFGSNRDFAETTMKLYLRDAPGLTALMLKALQEGDNGDLAEKAHALRGITGYFTKGEPYTLCRDLETLARAGELPEKAGQAERLMRRLQDCMDALSQELREYVTRGESLPREA